MEAPRNERKIAALNKENHDENPRKTRQGTQMFPEHKRIIWRMYAKKKSKKE